MIRDVRRFGGLLVALCFALLLPASGARLLAQTSSDMATIEGTILDPDGKAIVNAAVVVRNTLSGDVRATVSDAAGRFVVDLLIVGSYEVEASAPGFATARRSDVQISAGKPIAVTFKLAVGQLTEQVTVSAALPAAAAMAMSQGSLTARSAQSLISSEYIRNYTSPIADYSQVISMAPGTFSVSPNGVGLGDTKTFFRGFKDGYYNMTFDGLPFHDTNDPTHHSWAFFPSQTIGSTVFDRSPGSASSIGPSTSGGSVNMLSRNLGATTALRGTVSGGSFNTKLYDVEFDSGTFGNDGRSRLFLDAHQMKSDGYQTYNFQDRKAFSAKYQYAASDRTAVTAFASIIDLRSNTPNQKGATRAQIAQFGDNFLMTGDPASPMYYGYNFYHIPSDFEYVGIKSELGGGWTIDNKVYTLSYYNKQNYNGLTSITATSATDKLNSYRKYGDLVPLSHISNLGVFRTGLWSEVAFTDRYQTPSDPRTWVDAALPNFHEKFTTTELQPFAEYEFKVTPALRITPGIKLAYYKQDFTQYADNGKTVGNLGGAASIQHAATYSSWLPSFDVHYLLQRAWSVYGQYGRGQNIPPTSVFDVKNGSVKTLPNPVLTDTFQVGSVWKAGRATLDVDVYHIHFDNDYSSTPDPVSGEPVYFLNGASVTKGIEAESTLLVARGLSLYLNGTMGRATYTNTGLSVQNAPRDTETIGVNYATGSWSAGFYNKRVAGIFNDNGNTHEAVAIDPFNITNLFVNYTVRGSSMLSQTKIRLAVNNLFDSHSITAVNPASTTTSVPAPGDVLTLMAARSVSLSFTVGLSQPRP
jgi:iron complex outermembrane receptor protein